MDLSGISAIILTFTVGFALSSDQRLSATKDCLKTLSGVAYTGKQNVAFDRKLCINWDHPDLYFPDNSIKRQVHNSSLYPDATYHHNFCRNPLNDNQGPWCYLHGATNRNVSGQGKRWQYCRIPLCNITSSGRGVTEVNEVIFPERPLVVCHQRAANLPQVRWEQARVGDQYLMICPVNCRIGSLNLVRGCNPYSQMSHICAASTHAGITLGKPFKLIVSEAHFFKACQGLNGRWSYQYGDARAQIKYYAFKIEAYEKPPSPAPTEESGGTPPPEGTIPPRNISGPEECKLDNSFLGYRGRRSVTRTGRRCVRWSDPRLTWTNDWRRKTYYQNPNKFPDKDITTNYCRNPDDDAKGPWCYLEGAFESETKGVGRRFDYCNIPFCPFKPVGPTIPMHGVNVSCGLRPYGTVKVVGGTNSRLAEWPWLVRLSSMYMCGGTLIHPQWILSAAHCFYDSNGSLFNKPAEWRAYIGEHNTKIPPNHRQQPGIARIIPHPRYNRIGSLNDIALVKLSRPVRISPQVNFACVPPANLQLPARKLCYVAGWGRTEDSRTSDTPKHVGLYLVDARTCARMHSRQQLTDGRYMCAYHPDSGRDTCKGDSGGPLMCEMSNGQWILAGVTSHGKGCGIPSYPGIYTRVSQFVSWIQATINRNTT